MAESGVRATCFGGFTIVYRHRSTEWPVPYTDSHTRGAHEVIGRVKEPAPGQEGRGRKNERAEGGTKENTIDKDSARRREPIYVRPRQTNRSPLPFP